MEYYLDGWNFSLSFFCKLAARGTSANFHDCDNTIRRGDAHSDARSATIFAHDINDPISE